MIKFVVCNNCGEEIPEFWTAEYKNNNGKITCNECLHEDEEEGESYDY